MRFTSFIIAGVLAVVASAQSSTTTSLTPAQSAAAEVEKCLAACDASDTNCRAHCIAVPSPDTQNVNATTACVAACPQGNGTAADNDAYADCLSGCIGQFYFTSTGTPNLATSKAAAGSADSTPSVTHIATTITSGGSTFVTTVASTASTGTDSPKSTSSFEAGAAVYGPVGTIGAGLSLFGLLAGFIAL